MRRETVLMLLVSVLAGGVALAQEKLAFQGSQGGAGAYRAPAAVGFVWTDRADLESQILRRWGSDISAVGYGRNPEDLSKAIHSVSERRLIRAAAATSFGEFLRRLSGAGTATKTPLIPVAQGTGTPINDLTFVTTPPCRIFDTRLSAAGKMAAGSTRSFYTNSFSAGPLSWADQGGDGSLCPEIPLDPPAVLITITAAAPEAQGNARIWAYGAAEPFVSNLNFTAGVNIANTTSTPTCDACGPDVNIKVTQNVHMVGDVVGYFRSTDKSLDANVLTAPLINTAQISVGSAQGIAMPDTGDPAFAFSTILPEDYSANTDLTVRFVFTTADTACDVAWRANTPFFVYSNAGPVATVTVVPSGQLVTVPSLAGQSFSVSATVSATAIGPGSVLTQGWSRTDIPGDTCTGTLILRAVQVLYE